MINMIKADLFRMKKSRLLIIFLLATIGTYMISVLTRLPGGISLGMPVSFSEDSKLDVRMMGFNFTWYYLMIMPVYMIVTADFGEKTVKNTISSAISRKKYFMVKYFSALIFNTAVFLLVNVLFWLVNSAVNGSKYSTDFGGFIKIVLYQLPVIAAVTGFFILIAFLVKRTAAFNALTIILPLGFTLVALTMYGIKATKAFAEKTVLKYELGYMLNQIAKNEDRTYINVCMLMGAAVILLTFMSGYHIFTKKEID